MRHLWKKIAGCKILRTHEEKMFTPSTANRGRYIRLMTVPTGPEPR